LHLKVGALVRTALSGKDAGQFQRMDLSVDEMHDSVRPTNQTFAGEALPRIVYAFIAAIVSMLLSGGSVRTAREV